MALETVAACSTPQWVRMLEVTIKWAEHVQRVQGGCVLPELVLPVTNDSLLDPSLMLGLGRWVAKSEVRVVQGILEA